jgi:predicted RNase H-like HicB family nuclease
MEDTTMQLQCVVYRERDHYVAQCLNVDVSSFGASESEALENLREALELYFEDAPAGDLAVVESPALRPLTLTRASALLVGRGHQGA